MRKMDWKHKRRVLVDWSKNLLTKVATMFVKKSDDRSLLSPTIIDSSDLSYAFVRELEYAMSHDECRNIAITGVYGSGKSSVIATYLNKRFRKKRLLQISLSNFVEKAVDGKPDAIQEYENGVEYKIFQHILLQSNEHTTRQSSFHRIRYVSSYRAVILAILAVLALLSVLILLGQVHYIVPENVRRVIQIVAGKHWNSFRLWLNIICLSYVFSYVVYWCVWLIRSYSSIRINKLKANNLEIELEKSAEVFSKLLDEIMYYIKEGGYRIVLFEDLDRLQYPENLFLKLRELNILLNESEYYRHSFRKVRFMYAIRDDVFTGEIRTKCFDYMIPVIPLVDKYNAGDYLIEHHNEMFKDIAKRDLSVLGMYISGKRELANIVNEYRLSKPLLLRKEESMSSTKLLAMLVYKNMFPKDYANTYSKNSCLWAIFEHKKKFYEISEKEDLEEYEKIKNSVEATHKKIVKLRLAILNMVTEDGQPIDTFIVDGKAYTKTDIAESEELYDAFTRDQVGQFVYYGDGINGELLTYRFKYHDLKEEADTDGTYDEIMYNAQYQYQQEVKKKTNIHKKIQYRRNESVRQLMSELSAKQIDEQVITICNDVWTTWGKYDLLEPQKKLNREILVSFIRSGYLAEDYTSYMSMTYEGSLSEGDFHFLHSVMQGRSLNYDYHLTNCAGVLERLNSDNFKNGSALNLDLLAYILEKGKHTEILDALIETIQKHPDFLVEYIRQGDSINQNFVREVFNAWNNVAVSLSRLNSEYQNELFVSLFSIGLSSEHYFTTAEKDILAEKYQLLCQNIGAIDLNNCIKFIEDYNIHFNNLVPSDTDTKQLYDFVKENAFFVIKSKNLRVLYGDRFDTSAFDAIRGGVNSEMGYLMKNLDVLLDEIPDSSVNDSEESLVYLINWKKKGLPENILEYLKKQHNKVNIDEIGNSEAVTMLYENDLIIPTWNNVHGLLESSDVSNVLTDFVKRNYEILRNETYEIKDKRTLQKILFGDNNTLSLPQYQALVPCFRERFEDGELIGLDEERITILVENDLIPYSHNYAKMMEVYSKMLYAQYFIKHLDAFIADEEMEVPMSNVLGLTVLNSTLGLDKKRQFLDQLLYIETDSDDAEIYAEQVCQYYLKINAYSKADMDEIAKALRIYNIEGSWFVKIDLVNQINASEPYDRKLEELLLEGLGEYYGELNVVGGKNLEFEDNLQNEQLLNYLKLHGHGVSASSPLRSHGKLLVRKRRK